MTERTCQSCGRAFTSRRRDAAYCSCACRQRAHRVLSRIKPQDGEEVVGRVAQDKPIIVVGPATAKPVAGISVTGKEGARWRRPLVWPDCVG